MRLVPRVTVGQGCTGIKEIWGWMRNGLSNKRLEKGDTNALDAGCIELGAFQLEEASWLNKWVGNVHTSKPI